MKPVIPNKLFIIYFKVVVQTQTEKNNCVKKCNQNWACWNSCTLQPYFEVLLYSCHPQTQSRKSTIKYKITLWSIVNETWICKTRLKLSNTAIIVKPSLWNSESTNLVLPFLCIYFPLLPSHSPTPHTENISQKNPLELW